MDNRTSTMAGTGSSLGGHSVTRRVSSATAGPDSSLTMVTAWA